MQNGWIEFTETPVVQDETRIYVSLSSRGLFYLNHAALRALGEPEAVTLFYNKQLQKIGMRRASIDRPNAYILRKKDGRKVRGRNIYAANFCRSFRIRPMETFVFTAPAMEGDLLAMSLHGTKPVVTPTI